MTRPLFSWSETSGWKNRVDVYRQEILEHMRSPCNFGRLKRATVSGMAENSLCGDKVSLEISLTPKGRVRDVGFTGAGCAITTAAASMFTEVIKGKQLGEIAVMNSDEILKLLGLEVTPARVACATTVFKAAQDAFKRWHEKKEI